MPLTTLKAIIVGGGPVGLTAAHALHKAGIDFVLLERSREIVAASSAGGGLVLSPLGLRAMSELNILEQIQAASTPLGRMERMDHSGRDIGDSVIFVALKESLGFAPRVINRLDLSKVLYNTLPADAQSKVFTNKKLSDIISRPDGVTAVCADGSEYNASIVIGADGAHSMVRDAMRRLAVANGSTDLNSETPFLTTFRCMWISAPRPSDLPVATVCETHGKGLATQFFAGEENIVTGIYETLDAPTKDRMRHTKDDEAAFIKRWSHIPILPNGKLSLGELHASRNDAGLVSLEEGVLDHWHWNGRVVLAGDAAHKFTPSLGSGCNNGIMDVMNLVNQLHIAKKSASTETTTLSHDQLSTAFAAYQEKRQAVVIGECARSGQVTGTATWQTGVQRLVDQYVMSLYMVQKFFISSAAKGFHQTKPFEFTVEKSAEVAVGA